MRAKAAAPHTGNVVDLFPFTPRERKLLRRLDAMSLSELAIAAQQVEETAPDESSGVDLFKVQKIFVATALARRLQFGTALLPGLLAKLRLLKTMSTPLLEDAPENSVEGCTRALIADLLADIAAIVGRLGPTAHPSRLVPIASRPRHRISPPGRSGTAWDPPEATRPKQRKSRNCKGASRGK